MLLFPVDDKQSRLDGHDQVGPVFVKTLLLDVHVMIHAASLQCLRLAGLGLCVAERCELMLP